MGDDDLEASSDEAVDSEESSSNESEMNSLSDSVGKIKKKTFSSMKKWNDEKFLFALDRQLISSGIRLLLFLPAFAILAFFGAWSQATTSPDWWNDFVEPTHLLPATALSAKRNKVLIVLVDASALRLVERRGSS